jgi:hypothetical protein
MEQESAKVIKEIKKEILKDKLVSLIIKHKRNIIFAVAFILFLIVCYTAYSLYQQKKADDFSVKYSTMKNLRIEGNNEAALSLIQDFIKNGTAGYQFVGYMEKISILLNEGKSAEAILSLQEAYKNVSLSSYYKDLIKTIEFMVRMDNQNEDLVALKDEIKKYLDKNKSFYVFNLEIYAALLVKDKNYAEAITIYENIIENPSTPAEIKDRSKRIRGMLFAYTD